MTPTDVNDSTSVTQATESKPLKTKPAHAPMNQFQIHNEQLVVAGKTMSQVAELLGQTPFYVYDKSVIERAVETLRQILPRSIHLHYAIKANPLSGVVNHLAQLTDGLDVASAGELSTALNSGVAPSTISFAGPGKTNDELKKAVLAGVTINMESDTEMRRIVQIAETLDITPRVAIRVNPDFELKTSGMKMSGGPKPFGIDSEKVPNLLDELKSLPLEFQGFHIFCGSQNLKAEAIIDAHNKTFALAETLKKHWDKPISLLNIGGGLGVPYFPGEQRIDLNPIAENLEALLARYGDSFANTEIVMELGRYLVAESGLYVSQVVDIKDSRGETFVITDGGLHHHLAASGNFGQVIRKNYPVAVANRMSETVEKHSVSIVGPLCTPLDILAQKMTLPKIQLGDYIAIFQSGAYGASASPQGFLGHPPVKEVLL